MFYRWKSLRCLGLVGLAVHLCALPISARQEIGASPLRNYHFREYGAHAQNWAVAQDPRGVMYFGNSRGVLEYDGVEWRFIPVSNRSIVRSLAVDATGTVYVGAVGELGYLRTSGSGSSDYVSLVEKIDPEERDFGDVWRAFATGDTVYFWSRSRFFRWHAGQLRSWPSSDDIPSMVADKVLFNRQSSGLEILTEEGPTAILGGDQLAATGRIMAMIRHGEREILAGTRSGDLLMLSFAADLDGPQTPSLLRAVPFGTEVDALLREHKLYGGIRLRDDNYALATMTGGAVVIDRRGQLLRRIDPATGLQDPSVWALHADRQGGLWLGLNNGIARVEVDAPWTIFDQLSGLEGSITAIARHQGGFHVTTSLGLYALRDGRFHRIAGATPPCWSLLSYRTPGSQEANADRLLAGCFSHVVEVRDHGVLPVREGNNHFELRSSTRDPSIVYVGHERGAGVLRFSGRGAEARWTDEGNIEGVRDDVRSIAEDAAGNLWLGTYLSGAIRVAREPSSGARQLDRFGLEHGLPDLKGMTLLTISGQLVAALRHGGLYQFDTASEAFQSSSLLGPRFSGRSTPDGIYNLEADPTGGYWIRTSTGDREAATLTFRTAGGSPALEAPLRRLPGDMSAIFPDVDGVTWMGGTDEILVRFDTGVEKDYALSFSTLIREVWVNGAPRVAGSSPRAGQAATSPGDDLELAYQDNSLVFQFAATSYDDESANRYSYRLDGYDSDWSEWATDTKKEYTNLPEASYRFRVRGRNAYGTVGDEASFAFHVLAPWYRTPWARLSYVVLAGLFVYSVARLRSRGLERERDRLAEQQAALEAEIESRTRAEAERERVLGERQQLITELEARNAELARFNHTVAHDLRNPLTTIRNYLGLIKAHTHSGESERLLSDLHRVDQAAARLQQLLEELQEFSRIDRQSMPREKVMLAELVGEVLDELASTLTERGIEVEVTAGLPAVCGDRARLLEALRHLLGNAVQHLGDPPAPRIEVGVRQDDAGEVVFVRDNGRGIAADYHDRVFELFERLDAGAEGTGVGLALVKRIIEVHGGRVWVESEGRGHGSTFCFTLPA